MKWEKMNAFLLKEIRSKLQIRCISMKAILTMYSLIKINRRMCMKKLNIVLIVLFKATILQFLPMVKLVQGKPTLSLGIPFHNQTYSIL